MPSRIILLAGAPSASAVTDEQCSISSFNTEFNLFLESKEAASSSPDRGGAPVIAPWRTISLHRKPLRTGFSQAQSFIDRSFLNQFGVDENFLTPSSLASPSNAPVHGNEESEQVLNEFCEQSLALHNSLPSSQLDDENETAMLMEGASLLSNSTDASVIGAPEPPSVPPAHLSDLEDVPSAKQVISLQPQTITLNMIVGVLSVAQPRSITTRWGQTLSLVEILVGDDTRSGFAVTFWLSSDAAASGSISNLRRQDVVLLQNVALHVFRGKVYGQSLRRGQTKLHLLWTKQQLAPPCYTSKALNTANEDMKDYPQRVKTRLVRDWVLQYVGADSGTKGAKDQHVWDRPPEDTQD